MAEGYARFGARETAHALSVSIGSLAEVDTLLAVAEDQQYLAPQDLTRLYRQLMRCSRLVVALQKKVRGRVAT
jgi:four helix bundle protein